MTKCFKIVVLIFCFLLLQLPVFPSIEKVDGLEYDIRVIDDVPLHHTISKRFDLYEIYFENRSDKTFSIPGYSIDLGVSYSNIAEVNSLFKDKSNKNKLAVLNIAAGAASLAFGGIARTAASTVRSVGSFKRNISNFADNSSFLAPGRTYVIYPGDGLSLLLFVDKFLNQPPTIFRFICREEDSGTNYIVMNKELKLREGNNKNVKPKETKTDEEKQDIMENIIAAPETNLYK